MCCLGLCWEGVEVSLGIGGFVACCVLCRFFSLCQLLWYVFFWGELLLGFVLEFLSTVGVCLVVSDFFWCNASCLFSLN